MEVSVIDLVKPVEISSTVNPLARISRFIGEQGLPDCPAGTFVAVESVETESPRSIEDIEKAYLDPESDVVVTYRQESGNRYQCNIREFSLGEAAVIIQAASQSIPGEKETDRMIGLIDLWVADFKSRNATKNASDDDTGAAPEAILRSVS